MEAWMNSSWIYWRGALFWLKVEWINKSAPPPPPTTTNHQHHCCYEQYTLVNMPDPIHIWLGLEALLARCGPDDSGTLACFRTRSIWPKPDSQNKIRPRLVLHSMIWAVCGRAELNLKVRNCSGLLAFCQNQAWLFLHTGLLPDPVFGQNLTIPSLDHIQAGFAQCDPGLLWKNRTKLDVQSWTWHIWSGLIFFTLAVMAITGWGETNAWK